VGGASPIQKKFIANLRKLKHIYNFFLEKKRIENSKNWNELN